MQQLDIWNVYLILKKDHASNMMEVFPLNIDLSTNDSNTRQGNEHDNFMLSYMIENITSTTNALHMRTTIHYYRYRNFFSKSA